MSGTVHIVDNLKKNRITNASFYNSPTLPKKHNHVEIIFKDLKSLFEKKMLLECDWIINLESRF